MSARNMTARELAQLRKVRELHGNYLVAQSVADRAIENRDQEIRRLLKDDRFSQAEIAAACGLTRANVSLIAAKR